MNDFAAEIAYYNSLITPNKRERIDAVLNYRTDYLTVALENISQPHNASAVIRSCDIFGIQDLHVIEEFAKFKPQNTVSKGASKWVDLHKYPTTNACIAALKADGYRIVATTPHERGYTLDQLPLNQKTVLFFGTEITGISDTVIKQADDFVTIPMYGFTESFNISVSVALCLYQLVSTMHASTIDWQMSKEKKDALELQWLKRILHIMK